MADKCLHLFGSYFLVWVFVGWFVFGCGVAGGSLGLGCGRLRYLLSSAARRPPPSANSAVGDCLLCVPCKLGSEAFWPAKTHPLSSCSSIRSSSFCVVGAAHMSVMHIPSPCCAQSCCPGASRTCTHHHAVAFAFFWLTGVFSGAI